MEPDKKEGMWWLKPQQQPPPKPDEEEQPQDNKSSARDVSTSLSEFIKVEERLQQEQQKDNTDVASIIEEINRVAAESPLGPYKFSPEERSVDDLLMEAERIYRESSKSFDQLSHKSKTSQNVTDLSMSLSLQQLTATPQSPGSVYSDARTDNSEDLESYSDDFYKESKSEGVSRKNSGQIANDQFSNRFQPDDKNNQDGNVGFQIPNDAFEHNSEHLQLIQQNYHQADDAIDDTGEIIKTLVPSALEAENNALMDEVQLLRVELKQAQDLLHEIKYMETQDVTASELSLRLEKCLEDLKESEEEKIALQVQLDEVNKTHKFLKESYEDLLGSNKDLEKRVIELDSLVGKYKNELHKVQEERNKVLQNETCLKKLLENERQQSKSLRAQSEKDTKCIQDLNRQIKEMERIIARKHPDSVSALIVAAKNDPPESDVAAKKVLEDRIKTLQQEAVTRDMQSSKVFLDIQDRFVHMKTKYESHIQDLELHVSDLKQQLKQKKDTYDIYTQTSCIEQRIPVRCTSTVGTQVDLAPKKPVRLGQTGSNKPQKVDNVADRNRNIKNGNKKNANLDTPVQDQRTDASVHNNNNNEAIADLLNQLQCVKSERDKVHQQLCRLQQDYQQLKSKRLNDLNLLQEAHEHEISSYTSNIEILKEQLEIHQITISTLQAQLAEVQRELTVVTIERDHLSRPCLESPNHYGPNEVQSLKEKIVHLEKMYKEREHRLQIIVQGLAQKNITNRNCDQCAQRQQQLIEYKTELEHLLATLSKLKQ